MKAGGPFLAVGALLAATCALAEPSDYVHQPAVEFGEREIDFKFGAAGKGADPRQSAASVGFGYGVKEWWFTEVYVKYNREDGESARFDAVEWENKFQVTETGKYPLDLGFLLEIERPQNRAEGWEVKWGPLFQTEFGKVQVNFNPLLRRNYRSEMPAQTEFDYEWQVKYRCKKEQEFGAQGFGEMGKWNDWAPRDQQNHRLGPAVFGKISLGGRNAIQYNAAWLLGVSRAAPGHTMRLQVEFEF